jgi:nitronate monooxygenase
MRPDWIDRLKLPVIAAPMFLASSPKLVLAACRAGVVGAFPAANARSPQELEAWFDEIEQGLAGETSAAPFGVNVVLSRPARPDPLLDVLVRRKPPLVITSIGDPRDLTQQAHGWGGSIFHDVTTVRHAEKAAEAGVDGLVLVCAGAGGHSGAVNPFALTPQVRARFDGLIVLAGSIGDGQSILAAQALGADLVYMGTRFLATSESLASNAYKAMMLAAETKDVVYTAAISGIPASFLRQSIEAVGLDPDNLPAPKGLHAADLPNGVQPWRDVWSAGQGVGLITDPPSVAELVARLSTQYGAAKQRFR